VAIRVVVAEDSMLVREGIVRVLQAHDDLVVTAECHDLTELLEAVDRVGPDVVLTDIRMPPTGTDEGVRAAAELRMQHPDIGVLVLSQYAEPGYVLELLDGGSARRGYLLKERLSDGAELAAAIRTVADGGSVVDPKVVDTLVEARRRDRSDPLGRLTPREAEVLGEIAEGKSNAAIAESLVLSERAVAKHINSLFSKLDLTEDPNDHRRVKAVLLYLSREGS
jgi:DNA-binding NarL/FixJ family response regulator